MKTARLRESSMLLQAGLRTKNYCKSLQELRLEQPRAEKPARFSAFFQEERQGRRQARQEDLYILRELTAPKKAPTGRGFFFPLQGKNMPQAECMLRTKALPQVLLRAAPLMEKTGTEG